MARTHEYEFLERWVLPGTPAEVYAALVDFELYPRRGYPAYLSGHRDRRPEVGCTGGAPRPDSRAATSLSLEPPHWPAPAVHDRT